MIGKTTIDGLDLYGTYGMYITEGGYNSLVSYPALKPVPFNDWPEENGIEVDLSEPVLDTKNVTINFVSTDQNKLRAFYAAIIGLSSYRTFNFLEIGYNSVLLRIVAQQSLTLGPEGEEFTFSLTFSDDFPLRSYNYSAPSLGAETQDDGYALDGIGFNEYGIRVLQGSKAEVLKMPAIKQKLIRKYSDQPGILNGTVSQYTYDSQNIVSQSKEVTINCLIKTDTLGKFWRNYRAFLYDLKRPGPRYLYVSGATATANECFYKRSSVNQFFLEGGGIWCQFSLTMEFNNFLINNTGYG